MKESRAPASRVLQALLTAILAASPAWLEAGPVEAEFDLAAAVECREVSGEEFAAMHADQKVIEARLLVSLRMKRGSESDLEEVVIEITSPRQRLPVAGFEPVTQLESDLDGNIEITRTSEKLRSINAGLGGGVGVPVGSVDVKLAPNGNLGTTRRDVTTQTTRQLPPKQAVVVSGTIHDQHGVFYKFKPSPQGSLEGSRELVVRWIVPKSWRGDWVQVNCRATTEQKKYYLVKTSQPCGETTRLVGLYLAGNAVARRAALDLAAAQAAAARASQEGRSGSQLQLVTLPTLLRCSAAPSTAQQEAASTRMEQSCQRLAQLSGYRQRAAAD